MSPQDEAELATAMAAVRLLIAYWLGSLAVAVPLLLVGDLTRGYALAMAFFWVEQGYPTGEVLLPTIAFCFVAAVVGVVWLLLFERRPSGWSILRHLTCLTIALGLGLTVPMLCLLEYASEGVTTPAGTVFVLCLSILFTRPELLVVYYALGLAMCHGGALYLRRVRAAKSVSFPAES